LKLDRLDKLSINTAKIIAIELHRLLAKKSGPIKVLDVGAGSGEIWLRIEAELLEKFGESGSFEVKLLDANPVDEMTWNCGGSEVVRIVGHLPEGLENFNPTEFDLVVALDVIEHLTKSDGYRLLYQLNRLAECSVIQTPNGFLWQAPFRSNPFQAHISGWKPSELKALGWRRQFGVGGIKWLVGIGGRPRYAISRSILRKYSTILEKVIMQTSRIVLSWWPSIHGEFIAVRRRREFDLESDELQKQAPK
jgi:hypothetical protein